MGRRTASSSSTISTRSPASDPAGACALAPPPEGDSEGGLEGGVAGRDGGRYAGLQPVEGGPQRAHPHARRRASQGGHSRERRLPRLGRHRHGWVGGTTGRRGGGEGGVGGDAAGRW